MKADLRLKVKLARRKKVLRAKQQGDRPQHSPHFKCASSMAKNIALELALLAKMHRRLRKQLHHCENESF
jgi:hypothetical protein